MKKVLLFLLMIPSLSALSCKGSEIKPSVDFLTTKNAIETIESIIDAYKKRDGTSLREMVNPPLSEEILKGAIFREADLSFTNRMVRISDSEVKVNTNWTGRWTIDAQTISSRGMATFVLQKDGMRLVRVEGDNPFLIPQH